MKHISVNELSTLLKGGAPAELIDVRTPAEFETVHVPGAKLHPLDDLDFASFLASRGAKAGPLYILCHSGARAKRAAEKFADAGEGNCVVVEGGTQAWVEAGHAVERGTSKVIPLDRQLQICIGLLVLTGVLLSQFLNPAWIWFSGFIGCGLIFAGVTGFCAMRIVLARMPWNKGSGSSKGSCCTA